MEGNYDINHDRITFYFPSVDIGWGLGNKLCTFTL